MRLRILSSEDVRRCLPMKSAIEGTKLAFEQLSTGRATIPLRSRIDVSGASGINLFMPALLPGGTDNSEGALTVKVVSIYGKNPERGLPTIHAMVQLLEADTGRPLALLEGASLTAIRTGAASGAATDLLSRKNATTAGIFGSGVQARTQLEAICSVRSIDRVWVYSPNRIHAEEFATEMAGRGPIPVDIQVATDPRQAVADADIICAATTSYTPVFDGKDVTPGTHINGAGSFTPEMQEIDAETVCRSLVVVDCMESIMVEAGDLLIPIGQGLIDENHIHAELGEIVAGRKPSRQSDDEITFFKSCGVAVQDAIAAQICYQSAERQDLGTVVDV